MIVAVSGSTGLVGSALLPSLAAAGHETRRLVRTRGGDGIHWDPATGELDAAALEGVDAVVHLAGESIASGRWNKERKERIRKSRVDGTRLLAGALAGLSRRPKVLLSASAIGYYGPRDDAPLDESAPVGEGFLAEVCGDWEAATEPAARAGIRVVHARFGILLSPAGGALKKMLPPFRAGVGGRIGDGRQVMSWIALDDAVAALAFALADESLSGAVNVVSPRPLTNREFTLTLGRVLGRPTFMPLPAFGVKAMFGEMGQALLLSGARVLPRRLEAAGFQFQYPELDAALRHLLAS